MLETQIKNPHSKEEILSSMRDITEKVYLYYSSLPPEIFFNDRMGGWSPAQNLNHITFIAQLAILLLRIPFFFLIPFGKRRDQKDFLTLREEYIGSPKPIYIGPLAPAEIHLPPEPESVIRNLLVSWKKTNTELADALATVPESNFDEYSLPHPSLGMLSFREMMYVLIIHPVHHTYKVEQKTSRFVR